MRDGWIVESPGWRTAVVAALVCGAPLAAATLSWRTGQAGAGQWAAAERLARRAAPVVATARPLGTTPSPWDVVQSRMREAGVTQLRLERRDDGTGPYRLQCLVPVDPPSPYLRRFEASGPDPLAAMEQLLADVQRWRRAGRRKAPLPNPPGWSY